MVLFATAAGAALDGGRHCNRQRPALLPTAADVATIGGWRCSRWEATASGGAVKRESDDDDSGGAPMVEMLRGRDMG
jgi:hypothetical protein